MLPDWFVRFRERASRWAGKGGPFRVIFKTALLHTAVWGGATLAGLVVGALMMWAFGIYPIWAWGFGLLGDRLGARFYLDRELIGENSDFWRAVEGEGFTTWQERWLARLDSFVDWALPAVVSTVLLAGGGVAFGLWGLLL